MKHWVKSLSCPLSRSTLRGVHLAAILVISYMAWFAFESFSPLGSGCVLKLDVKVPAGNRIEAYFNDSGYPIFAQRATAERTTVVLTGTPAHINTLRLDLSEVANIPIEIFGVTIERRGKTLASFSPEALKSAVTLQGAVIDSDTALNSSLRIRSLTNDPIIIFSPRITSATIPLFDLGPSFLKESPSLTLVGISLFILALLGTQPSRITALGCAALMGLGWFGLYRLASDDLPKRYSPIDLSVGQASYAGYPKGTEFLLYKESLLLVVALGVLAGTLVRLCKRYRQKGGILAAVRSLVSCSDCPSIGVSEPLRRSKVQIFGDIAIIAALTLHYFLLMFPALSSNLHALQQPLSKGIALGGFDGANVFTWCAFRVFGFMAHRDYWFPYTGFYNALYDTPMDLLRNHVHTTIVWGVVLFGAYRLANFSKLGVLATSLFLYLMAFNGLLGGHSRYLMGIGLVLVASVSFLVTARPLVWALFGAYLGYVLGKEPHQVIYSSLALILIVALGYQRWRASTVTMMGCVGIGLGATTLVWLLPLVQSQQLENFLAFFIQAGGMLSSVAVPSEIVGWIVAPAGPDSLLLLGGLSLLVIGAYFTVGATVRNSLSPLVTAAFGLGLLFSIVFTKQLVRPHIATQLVGIPLFGWLLLTLAWSQTWTTRQRVWFTICLGCFFAHLDASAFGPTNLWNQSKRIAFIKPDVTVALNPEIRALEVEEKLYSLSRFTPALPFLSELSSLLDRDASTEGSRPLVYVLGDASFVYPVLHQLPPRFISFYDGSDIRAQTETVSWIGLNEPKYVIWNPAEKSFDGVPNVVRTPKVFAYISRHYRFERDLGGMHLLIRKDYPKSPKGPPADPMYWSRAIGAELELGALPALSSIRYREICSPGSVAFCEPVIRIDLKHKASSRQLRKIDMVRGKEKYTISFLTQPKMRSYSIKASSIWFSSNTPIQEWSLTCAGDSPDCEHIRVEHRRFPMPQLY